MTTSAAPPAEPVGYILWHREHTPRARWKKVATVPDRASALARANGKGDWHLAPIFDAALLEQPSPRLIED